MEYNTHGSLALWTPAFVAAASRSRSQDGARGCSNAGAVAESLTGGYRMYRYRLEVLGQLNPPEENFTGILGQPSLPEGNVSAPCHCAHRNRRTHVGDLKYGLDARTMAAT